MPTTTPTIKPAIRPHTSFNITSITTPLIIKVSYIQIVRQWYYQIQFGTPPQAMNIIINSTANLLWAVSELCMSPFGNACNVRPTNFFNTSLSNVTSNFTEFTMDYIDGTVLTNIWAYDTITINNQIFDQLQFDLPKDINGTKNVVIPDYIAGQIGLKPYQNLILDRFDNQIVGIAISPDESNGGTITFGGVDSSYIAGDIAYYPLLPFSETNQQIQISVTNIYVGGFPLNIAGTVSLNSEIPNIQFNDDTVNLILSLLPGGNYSKGTGMVNCPISTSFDLSFEFKDQDIQKWRLPSYAIADNSVDTNICNSTITGGAIDTNSWVFGSAFITSAEENNKFPVTVSSDTRELTNQGNYPSTPILNDIIENIATMKILYSGSNKQSNKTDPDQPSKLPTVKSGNYKFPVMEYKTIKNLLVVHNFSQKTIEILACKPNLISQVWKSIAFGAYIDLQEFSYKNIKANVKYLSEDTPLQVSNGGYISIQKCNIHGKFYDISE
ncbi:17551_t:CDS:2 [Gigaspora margarita]|uniref:17551_t:CDS:1 n=1 Tax=Gigaspora margarita TaxID=4874 RepID=A0ABN7UGX5_GIGMA|nr:17551_t:CDS:2 [Gigaspora margarita]